MFLVRWKRNYAIRCAFPFSFYLDSKVRRTSGRASLLHRRSPARPSVSLSHRNHCQRNGRAPHHENALLLRGHERSELDEQKSAQVLPSAHLPERISLPANQKLDAFRDSRVQQTQRIRWLWNREFDRRHDDDCAAHYQLLSALSAKPIHDNDDRIDGMEGRSERFCRRIRGLRMRIGRNGGVEWGAMRSASRRIACTSMRCWWIRTFGRICWIREFDCARMRRAGRG